MRRLPVPNQCPYPCHPSCVDLVRGSGNVGRPRTTLAPLHPLFLTFQLEGPCVQQRLLERQELLLVCQVASAQPVPIPLPPLVLVDLVWGRGNVGRPRTALAPRLPLFLAFSLRDRACSSASLNGRNLSSASSCCQCPASAPTLATPRACRLFLGERECWQDVHRSCTTSPTLCSFSA